MSTLKFLVLASSLPLLTLGARSRQDSPNFMLYGYSDQFGGNSLVYADGYAYVGNQAELNATDSAIVQFVSDSSNTWHASPNVTMQGGSSWSNATFFVPSIQSSDRRVGFLNSSSSTEDRVTSGFRLYGSLASLVTDEGNLESLWTGLQVGEHVHALYWNDTSLGQIPITLTTVGPSNPSD